MIRPLSHFFEGFGPEELKEELVDEIIDDSKLLALPAPRENLVTIPGHKSFQEFACGKRWKSI